jgi:hypothetical protein
MTAAANRPLCERLALLQAGRALGREAHRDPGGVDCDGRPDPWIKGCYRIFRGCWKQIGGTTGARRAFSSGWSETAVCLSRAKMARASNLKTGWPRASERLGSGRRGRAYCFGCLQIRRRRHLDSLMFLCPTASLHRIFRECWIQIDGTTGARRAFSSGWLETAVCLPSQIGYGRKFLNGPASRLGEAWGGPTRESVLLQPLY